MEQEIPELTQIGAFRLVILNVLGEEKGMECLKALAKELGTQDVQLRNDMSKRSFAWKSVEEYVLCDKLASMLCTFSEPLSVALGTIWAGTKICIPKNLAADRAFTREVKPWETVAEDDLDFNPDPVLNKIFNERFNDQINKTAVSTEGKKNNRLFAKALIKGIAQTLPADKKTLGMDILTTYAMARLTLDRLQEEIHKGVGDTSGAKFTALNQLMKTLDGLLATLDGFNGKGDGKAKKGLDGLMDRIGESDEPGVTDDPEELQKRASSSPKPKRGRPSVH